jgi:hypothetical protein
MNWRILLAIVASCFTLAFTAAPASAQATRTWVSATGLDSNPCSRTQPCLTFAGALGKTLAGGEINCIDAGGYGTVTITQSITIDCQGTLGSTLASSATGMTINGANIVVVLRNLTIDGAPPNLPGTIGVRILQAAQVNIENVRIQGFRAGSPNGFGIRIEPTSGTVVVYIADSIISHNGAGFTGGGMHVAPTGSAAVALFLDNVEVNNNRSGILYNNGNTTSSASTLSIRSSTLSANAIVGLQATSGSNALGVMLDDVVIDAGGTGFQASGTGVAVRVGGSVITRNNVAVLNTSASVQSFKTNQIDLNGNNSTPIPQVQLQ